MLDPDGFALPSVPLKGYEWFVYELMSLEHLITQPEAKSLYKALDELRSTLLKIEDRSRNWNLMRPHELSSLSTEFIGALRSEKEKGKFRVANAKARCRIDKFLADSEEAVTRRFEKMRQAADFLRDLANMCRSKGAKAGDRATGREILKALTVLRRLAEGVPMKAISQVAVDGQVDDAKSLKNYKSLERLVARFSMRVAKAVRDQYGPRIVSLDYPHLFMPFAIVLTSTAAETGWP